MFCEVTQYLRPDGRKNLGGIDIDDKCMDQYRFMQDQDRRIAMEVLTTGEVSVTMEDDEQDYGIRIVPNGIQVKEAVEDILERNYNV